jgi:GNAT superfamily N-acetyltransferase
MEIMEWQKDNYTISTDKSKIDLDSVHHYLSIESYWAQQIPLGTVRRSIENSLCFGVYYGREQAGFARVISDFATFAYLGDVFIFPEHRGKGLSKWLMEVIVNYPQLQGLRRFLLTTKDAHTLYSQFGFEPYHQPERLMARNYTDMYKSKK